MVKLLSRTFDFNNNKYYFNYFVKDNEVYIMAKQLAQFLNLKNTNWSIRQHVNDKYKCTLGEVRTQETQISKNLDNAIFINRAGVAQLLINCRKASTRPFKQYFLNILLPSMSLVRENRLSTSSMESRDALVPTTNCVRPAVCTEMLPPSTTVVLKKSVSALNIINKSNDMMQQLLENMKEIKKDNERMWCNMQNQLANAESMTHMHYKSLQNVNANLTTMITCLKNQQQQQQQQHQETAAYAENVFNADEQTSELSEDDDDNDNNEDSQEEEELQEDINELPCTLEEKRKMAVRQKLFAEKRKILFDLKQSNQIIKPNMLIETKNKNQSNLQLNKILEQDRGELEHKIIIMFKQNENVFRIICGQKSYIRKKINERPTILMNIIFHCYLKNPLLRFLFFLRKNFYGQIEYCHRNRTIRTDDNEVTERFIKAVQQKYFLINY